MEKPFVDLHVHSCFSDGSMTPAELAAAADESGVGLLALADHDIVDGIDILRAECEKYGIRCIPAVEVDSLDGGTNFHILAYGFDCGNTEFTDFLRHTRFLLDEASVKLVERLHSDYPGISISDYMDFYCDSPLGGWKALYYLMEKGLTSSLKEGIKFYVEYGLSYAAIGYSTVAAVAYRIKKAGGYSVLAHPGESMDTADIAAFRAQLCRLVSMGLDGIECYYPSHSPAVTEACLDVCRQNDLLITAGSDCHGLFGSAAVGQMNITADMLRLKDLPSKSRR